jgi:hypothetical protein
MRPVVVLSAFVVLACGCENRREHGEDLSPEETAAPTSDEAPVEPQERHVTHEPGEGPEATERPGEQTRATQEAGEDLQAVQKPGEELAKPLRDLAAELRAAVGSPLDCLQDYQPGAATVIRVGISAIVRPSGLVIEPSASGRGLSVNDRRCIEQRVGDVVLPALDTQTSQPVSTYVELDYQPPSIVEDDVGIPTPKLKDVVNALPKKETIPRSGTPIDKAPSDPIDGPRGVPIEGSKGVPIEGPRPKPIDGYEEIEEDSERWTD